MFVCQYVSVLVQVCVYEEFVCVCVFLCVCMNMFIYVCMHARVRACECMSDNTGGHILTFPDLRDCCRCGRKADFLPEMRFGRMTPSAPPRAASPSGCWRQRWV